MLSKLIIDPNLNSQQETVDKLLTEFELTKNHPDLLWIESQEDKALGVKEAKSVRKHFSFKPLNSKVKIAVIIGADTLSIDAQNSLLKILEEPPANAGLILTATSESNLLPTILSRCQIAREGSHIKKMEGKNHE